MSISKPTFKVRADEPFRFEMPGTVYYKPCALSSEQVSTIPQIDQVHESLAEIANMLTDNISTAISTDTLKIIADYVICSCPSHFYIEEKLLTTFFPALLRDHRYAHIAFSNRIEGVELKFMVSPSEAQQYLTNVLLNLILDHFVLQDIPWMDMYKSDLTQEERDQFMSELNIYSLSDSPNPGSV